MATRLNRRSAAGSSIHDLALRKFKQARRLHEAGDLADAVKHYGFALALNRNLVDAHLCRGVALALKGDLGDALVDFEHVLATDRANHGAHNNRANILLDQGQNALAIEAYTNAIKLRPDFAPAHKNRGIAQLRMAELDGAIEDFERSLQLAPELHDARTDRGFTKLLAGDLKAGFEDLESRRLRDEVFPYSSFPGPTLRPGVPVDGKTILVYNDGGFGDVLQFSRYFPLLKAAGATTKFLVDRRLHKLLKSVPLAVELCPDRESVGRFDALLPLLSLPYAFGTSLPTIPSPLTVLADPGRVAKWRERIGERGFKIGIQWQGRISPVDRGRSLPLAEFGPLSDIPGVRLISLQKNEGSEQIVDLPQVEDLASDLDNGEYAFEDTAALMECLDLVVSSDTAIAHLAGSMNKPVWVLLQYVPDWRWMLSRSDSPWYPCARLYRQDEPGAWPAVIDKVREDLGLIVAGRKALPA
jgi:Flp pilus assembly protein TadD